MQLAEQGQLLASAARFSIALANLHTSPAQAMPFGKQQDKDTKVQWQVRLWGWWDPGQGFAC